MFSLSTLILTITCLAPAANAAHSAVAFAPQEPAVAAAEASVAPAVSPEERLKRTFIYTTGSRYVLQLVLDTVLETEIARRKEAGVFVGKVDVTAEEVQAEVKRRFDMVMVQDPTMDFWAMVRAQGFTEATFAQELRRGMVAQRMFFPSDPEQWPVAQIEEILGDQWQAYLKKDYDTMLEKKAAGEAIEPLNDQMLNQFLMPGVWQFLRQRGKIEKPSSGLPEGVSLIVDGKEFLTNDILATITPMLSDTDRLWAETFLANLQLLESDLKKSGHYMNQADFDQFFADEGKVYEGTIISHEMMVLQFLGFPSMEIYRDYLRARRSFHGLLPEATSEQYLTMLDDMVASRSNFYGAGKVQAEVLLVSAREKATGKFRMEGDPFESAQERADEVRQILADGEPFDTVLLQYSDYPESVAGSASSMPQPNRGRFQALSRNDLRGFLLENDYTDFLFGYSVSDDIFFRADLNAVYGPIKGPLGYYFYRVISREAPQKEIDLMNDVNAQWMVNDDLLGTRYIAHLTSLRKAAAAAAAESAK
jgi:hypothetical protein